MDSANELTAKSDRRMRQTIAKKIQDTLIPIVTLDMAYFGHEHGKLVFSYNKLMGISAEQDLDDALTDYALDNNHRKLDGIISKLKKVPERLKQNLDTFEQSIKFYIDQEIKITMVFKDTPERNKRLEELRLKGPALLAQRKADIVKIEQALKQLDQLITQSFTAATPSTMNTIATAPTITRPAVTSVPEQRKGMPGNLVTANLSLRRS